MLWTVTSAPENPRGIPIAFENRIEAISHRMLEAILTPAESVEALNPLAIRGYEIHDANAGPNVAFAIPQTALNDNCGTSKSCQMFQPLLLEREHLWGKLNPVNFDAVLSPGSLSRRRHLLTGCRRC